MIATFGGEALHPYEHIILPLQIVDKSWNYLSKTFSRANDQINCSPTEKVCPNAFELEEFVNWISRNFPGTRKLCNLYIMYVYN